MRTAPDDTLSAGIHPSATSRYTVARETRSRSATSRTVRRRGAPGVRCAWIVPDAAGSRRRSRSVSKGSRPAPPVVPGTSVVNGREPTVSDTPGGISGPRGRRFKSCLPDSEGRDSARETDGSRPSPFPDGALRTTGAPKSATLGADGAACASPNHPPRCCPARRRGGEAGKAGSRGPRGCRRDGLAKLRAELRRQIVSVDRRSRGRTRWSATPPCARRNGDADRRPGAGRRRRRPSPSGAPPDGRAGSPCRGQGACGPDGSSR
jgi:hypothetical protein